MHLPEHRESLWDLIVSPIFWAAHFLACYLTAAIWCERAVEAGASLGPVRWAFAIYTIIALAGIGRNGWSGFKRYRRGSEPPPFDLDTPLDRHRFLGFSTLLLAGMSAIATAFVGLVALFFHDCN